MTEAHQRPISFRDPCELRALDAWLSDLDENRGDRAMLRRCRNPLEVAFTPAFHALVAAMRTCGRIDDKHLDRLALVAGVVAHTDPNGEPASAPFAGQMAADNGGRALVSDLRFRRLLAEDDPARLYEMMIRLVRQLGRHADIASLAAGIYRWDDQTKKRWAQDYYDRAPAQKREGED